VSFFLLFIFSSCTISYFYRGSDLIKQQRKNDKQVQKGINQFKLLSQVEKIQDKLKRSIYEKKDQFNSEVNSVTSKCRVIKSKVEKEQKKRQLAFKKLNIQKKKKYSSKSKKYNQIKKYIDDHEKYADKLTSLFEKAKKDCGRIQTVFDKYQLKLMDAKKAYKEFNDYKTKLKKSEREVVKNINKVEKQLNSQGHKNSVEIKKELNLLRVDLETIFKNVAFVETEVRSLHQVYGDKGILPVFPESEAGLAMKRLKNKTDKSSQSIKKYNERTKKLNKLIKD
jgi:methyl-accepting chemotaxis protein